MAVTGTVVPRTTVSAALPSSTCPTRPVPWWPITTDFGHNLDGTLVEPGVGEPFAIRSRRREYAPCIQRGF